MTSNYPTPAPLDDVDLLRAATTPRRRLFLILNRASAFAPLIVVCCVLPAFQLLATPTLDEEGALWGLRGLAVADATNLTDIVQPGLNEAGEPLIYQPPLAAWLNGIAIGVIGAPHLMASSLVSLIATALAIWLATRLAWRMGGANTALISAVLMCSHPQVLTMATAPSNGSVGLCLMLASVFGFQRHLEGRAVRVSSSLAISGIVWGLSLLAIGPVAFSVPILFMLHALNQKTGMQAEFVGRSFRHQLLQSRTVIRSTLFLVATGLLVGLWWNFVMFAAHGTVFLRAWLTGLPVQYFMEGNIEWQRDLRPLLQPTWHDWFNQQSLIVGWLIVGLERSWHAWRRPPSELARRRFQLLMLWWAVAFGGRVVAEFPGMEPITNTSVWNIALLGPTILLSSLGIGTLIERDVSKRGEYFLVILLVSLTAARVSTSWLIGLACGAVISTFLIFAPLMIRLTGRTAAGWSEEAWRQLLQFTVYGSLIVCLWLGLGMRNTVNDDFNRLAELRERLKDFPEVQRISLIAVRGAAPNTLRYLLRSRWPMAELTVSEAWDVGLTEAMNEESKSPHSRFLILEWTRREIRLSADTGHAWKIKAVGDPMRFQGRRLSMVLIEPRT